MFCLLAGPAQAQDEIGSEIPGRAEFAAKASALAGLPGKAHELIKLADAALADGADDDSAYAALAHGYKSHALWLRNDYAKAEAEARRAINADPGAPLSYFFLTDALNALLRYDDAYLACLHGAERRGDAADVRTRCRDDYARRVTLDPAAVLKAAQSGRLSGASGKPQAGPILVSGRIAAVTTAQGKDEIVFKSGTGTLTCLLAPAAPGKLAPMTSGEEGKHSSLAAGLRKDQFVTIRGVVRNATDKDIYMESCEVFTR
jgi:tetratricopeptide (TPR) repeat protein